MRVVIRRAKRDNNDTEQILAKQFVGLQIKFTLQ